MVLLLGLLMLSLNFGLCKKTFPAYVMLCITLLLTVLASLYTLQSDEANKASDFSFVSDQVTIKIQDRLTAYALILKGAGALFATKDSVDRQKWRTYTEALQVRGAFPGVKSIGFTQLIPASELAAHVSRIRGEGFPKYAVYPDGKRSVYTSIIYIEPFRDRNLKMLGYDMLSESVRRVAMESARDTGRATLSSKVGLAEETGTGVQTGTLMYVPVYHNSMPKDTPEQRRAALIGWVYGSYYMKDFMSGILHEWANNEGKLIDLKIYDGLQATPTALLFGGTHDQRTPLHQRRTIEFNGHQWLLTLDQSTAAPAIWYVGAWGVLIGGLALSALLFVLLLSILNMRDKNYQLEITNLELTSKEAEIARKAEELATINKELASQVEMESLAFYDPLTNLPNRRLLFDRLTQKLASSVRTHEYGALFFIDLDHFKILNDTYGHAMGDLLLQRVGERLSGNIRSSDTAARLGGDEFVLLLSDLSRDHTDAIRQAQVAGDKLLKTLSAPYQLGESTHHITASIGITIFGNLPIIAEDLLKQADTAMYDAKNMGRNTLSFFNSKLVIEKIK